MRSTPDSGRPSTAGTRALTCACRSLATREDHTISVSVEANSPLADGGAAVLVGTRGFDGGASVTGARPRPAGALGPARPPAHADLCRGIVEGRCPTLSGVVVGGVEGGVEAPAHAGEDLVLMPAAEGVEVGRRKLGQGCRSARCSDNVPVLTAQRTLSERCRCFKGKKEKKVVGIF